MPDFHVVPHPVFTPTLCALCSTHAHRDGFLDTGVDLNPPHGHLYVCAGCVYAAARALGCLDPVQAVELRERLVFAAEQNAALEGQLEYERANKVVAVSDMTALIDRIRGGIEDPPDVTVVDVGHGPWALAEPLPGGTCTATRADGAPCTAKALPGRDVCVAHSKQRTAA